MADFYRYGVQDVVLFTLVKRSGTDYATSGDYVPVVSDIRVAKDTASESYAANVCATTSGTTWALTLTAAELSAKKVVVTLIDAATPNKAVEDQAILIHTFGSPLAQMPFDFSINTVTVATNNDKTGYAVGAGGIISTSFAAGAIDAAALAQDGEQEIADEILNRNLAGGGSGGARIVRDALRVLRNKVDTYTGTVYQEDDATPAWTFTIATDSQATRIVGIDPA